MAKVPCHNPVGKGLRCTLASRGASSMGSEHRGYQCRSLNRTLSARTLRNSPHLPLGLQQNKPRPSTKKHRYVQHFDKQVEPIHTCAHVRTCICICVCTCVCICICLSVSVCFCLCLCVCFFCLPGILSAWMSVCLSVCLSFCLSESLSDCLFVCPPVCMYTYCDVQCCRWVFWLLFGAVDSGPREPRV